MGCNGDFDRTEKGKQIDMLKHYKSIETSRQDGDRTLAITDELVDDPCARCGGESVPNVCEGDEKFHYHGRVHTVSGGLDALCKACGQIAAQEWKDRKAYYVVQVISSPV